MTLRYYTIVLSTAALLTGCSSGKSKLRSYIAENPVAIETVAAGDFLVQLHKQSLLPGDTKDMHGEINSAKENFPLPDEVVYPLSRTFEVTYRGQTFTNNYTVMRSSKDTSWRLQKAWRTDSSGVIEEWPVK